LTVKDHSMSLAGTSGSFRRNALILTAGTATAQVVPLLAYPLFTRLYTPSEFGVFATVSLFAALSAIIASGTYEQAILIAPTRRAASRVAAYALLRAALVLAGGLALAVPLSRAVVRLGVDPAVAAWLPAVPVMAAALVVYNCYSEWCVRNQYFGELSRVRIWQTSAIAGIRLGLGVFTPALNGFVAGDLLGKIASAGRCGAMVWRRDRKYLRIRSVARVRDAARRFAHIARYTLPDQLINTFSGSIHVIFFGAAFGTAELGYVTLVLSLMYLPVTVISSAVKDVFRQRASLEYVRDGSCRPTYRRLLAPILFIATAGFGLLYAIAPVLFTTVLGANWAVAGDYARILTPLFFWNFVSMSLGGVFVIAERTDVSLAWQVASLLITVVALFVGTRLLQDMVAALWCFSIARSIAYLLYMGLSYAYAERPAMRPA
jgi:O-antigen/teichoic acid export membrane protein